MIFKTIERFRNSENFKTLEKDYFLVSLFSSFGEGDSIEEWTLLFYNPKTKKILDFHVGDEIIRDNETNAIKEYKELPIDDVQIDSEKVLKNMKFEKKPSSVLMTLHMKDVPCWTINMIYPTMKVKTYVINAINSELIEEKDTSLLQK